MSGSQAVLDKRSLTLPNWRTALKRRLKRPRKPSFYELMALFCFFMWAFFAVIDLSLGRTVDGVVDILAAVLYWGIYQMERFRADEVPVTLYWLLAPAVIIFAAVIGGLWK